MDSLVYLTLALVQYNVNNKVQRKILLRMRTRQFIAALVNFPLYNDLSFEPFYLAHAFKMKIYLFHLQKYLCKSTS